ncbi:signal recognition particle protein [Purpureocillium lavendulum]|uniref:Signal recognition particle subunit SRP72 n=1 Tax=Purpureocillium lavendulum TaxID=1247861 RepID=A0AB34FYS7_9HYPO|nr:signal recognition particle protein [Purpureocillium lavendulum]
MGSFGAAVHSLVETYSRCLAALHELQHGDGNRGDGRGSKRKTRLGTQMRSDRSLITRTYQSKLSRRGGAFELGDAPATSSLKRVARKLRTALGAAIDLLSRDSAGKSSLDYASLTAVSHESRRDALRTMTSLSARLSSPHGHVRSYTSASTGLSANKKPRRKHRTKGGSSSRSVTSTSSTSSTSRDEAAVRQHHCTAWPSETHQYPAREKHRQGIGRYSSATFSSQSTKLGEIRPRRQAGGGHGNRSGYHAAVTYPLPYPWMDASEGEAAPNNGKRDPAAALAALLRAATIDDHEEVLKAANAAIKANKNDEDAQHTRVVALLKLDRFDDAVRAISEGGVKIEARCALEKAYALYKLGKLDEAAAVLKSFGLEKRSFSHVASQVAYRAERFGEAEVIYRRLLTTGDASQEENDLNINLRAAMAQAEWQGTSTVAGSADESPQENFELCYNVACAHIARGSLGAAASLLQRAAKLCDASEDLTEEDKKAELKPILAQQAYVHAKLGDTQRALDLYQSLGTDTDIDPDFVVVAQNNKSALETKPSNPFLLQRQAAAWMSGATNAKLFGYQSGVLARNQSVLDILAHKSDGVRERTRKILDQAHQPTIRQDTNATAVVNAAAKTQDVQDKEVIRELVSLSKKHPDNVGLILVIIQLHLKRKNRGAALSVLEIFFARLDNSENEQDREVRFSPGLVALAVSLMRAQGRDTSAKSELVKAAAYWRDRPVGYSSSLLKEAGVELSRSSKSDDLSLAANAFQRLYAENKDHPVVRAGLVAALAASDITKVEQYAAQLPPVQSLLDGIDAEALVRAGVAATPSTVAPGRKRPAPGETGDEKAAKKRRRRRLPKNYVEGKTPDPERWLPLRDRSTYRPKGKKGKKKVGESTQGGIVKEEETLDLVGGGGVKVEKSSASNPSKKKKKGKK